MEGLRENIMNYYKRNIELVGYKGLIKKLVYINDFTEENILEVCKEYNITSIEQLKNCVLKNINTRKILQYLIN